MNENKLEQVAHVSEPQSKAESENESCEMCALGPSSVCHIYPKCADLARDGNLFPLWKPKPSPVEG